MNSRIQQVRKAKKLTQDQFAEKIGLSKNYVWMMEKGERIPSDRTLKDICREFCVNEKWLTTGQGDMFIENREKAELADFLGEILAGESDDFRVRMIEVLSQLKPSDWEVLQGIAESLVKKE